VRRTVCGLVASATIRSSSMRDAIAAPPSSANGMAQKQTNDSGPPVSRIVASVVTIGGIDDDTVMAADVAIQIHVTSAVVEPNGLPMSAPASTTKKIPA
jgi:hypothetical protein